MMHEVIGTCPSCLQEVAENEDGFYHVLNALACDDLAGWERSDITQEVWTTGGPARTEIAP